MLNDTNTGIGYQVNTALITRTRKNSQIPRTNSTLLH